jgi:hypothetical protein
MSRSSGKWSYLFLFFTLFWVEPGYGQIRIPGTRLSIIPPSHFYLNRSFPGLLKSDGKVVIQVYDLRDGNFYTDSKNFSKDQFESKGAKVLALKSLQVVGYPARFCIMEGDSSKRIMALVFGDSTFSTTLIGLYPDTDQTAGGLIRDAFASISYDKAQVLSPFETAPFYLDTAASGFKFAVYKAPMFIYSRDGKEPAQGSPFLSVTAYPRKPGESLQTMSENLIVKDMQHGLTDPDLRNISFDSAGRYEAYEVEIYCKLGGQDGVIYQFIAASRDNIIVIEGIANSAFDENIKAFRKLAHTIKIQ